MSATPKLEPCPWCGKELWHNGHRINPYAICRTEDCFGQRMPVVSSDVPHMVEQYNRRAALSAGLRETDLETAITRIIQDACELPDRTSPDDQPEMLLITGDELDMLLRRHLGLEDAAGHICVLTPEKI